MRPSITIKPQAMIAHTSLLVVGMVCLYFALMQYQKTHRLLSSGIITTATVIELIGVQGEDGDLFKPKFRFMDQQHKPVEFIGMVSSKPPAWDVGEQTAIVYPPNRVDDVRIVSYWNLFRWSILLSALAAPFLVIGFGYFVFHLYSGDLNAM